MTMPYERTRAILGTRTLLENLIDPKKTPKVPEDIRVWAGQCLRHYPSHADLQLVNNYFNCTIMECPIGDPDTNSFDNT